ncbi:MAG: hypothetical protein HKN23_02035, partial [Verrucomicrobiales bacterium]|nr:hypothetical protein [Verrucomicrobiales bacterium]
MQEVIPQGRCVRNGFFQRMDGSGRLLKMTVGGILPWRLLEFIKSGEKSTFPQGIGKFCERTTGSFFYGCEETGIEDQLLEFIDAFIAEFSTVIDALATEVCFVQQTGFRQGAGLRSSVKGGRITIHMRKLRDISNKFNNYCKIILNFLISERTFGILRPKNQRIFSFVRLLLIPDAEEVSDRGTDESRNRVRRTG